MKRIYSVVCVQGDTDRHRLTMLWTRLYIFTAIMNRTPWICIPVLHVGRVLQANDAQLRGHEPSCVDEWGCAVRVRGHFGRRGPVRESDW